MAILHLVSHTHWDREWYQTFQQFRLRLVRLVDNLLDILDADPDYRYFMLDGQTIVLEDYLQMRPEKEADLRNYIQQGRILIGPWYILPDEFLVSPEATIRNLLEGDRTARAFGPKMSIGYLPDTFGHIGQMPQILRGFNIDSASIWRGVGDWPCEFWWQAPDGSRVLTAYLRESYGYASGLISPNFDSVVAGCRALADNLRPHALSGHILLMNGTDHQEASPLTSQAVAYAQGKTGEDILVHSTLPQYVAQVRQALDERLADLPVVSGEFRLSKRSPLLPGVLSTRMWIKQRNRACETLLERWAEPFSAWAVQAVSQPRADFLRRPADILRQAWRLLIQCHPHDSICGCSIDAVHDEMRSRFEQVETIGEEVVNQSLAILTGAITTRPAQEGALAAIVVFNPSAAPRQDLLEADVTGIPQDTAFEIRTAASQVVPYQVLSRRSETLADMTMTALQFQGAVGEVIDGQVAGLKIQAMRMTREGSQVYLHWIASMQGEPNLVAWERGSKEVKAVVGDPTIETYRIQVDTPTVTRLRLAAPQVPGLGYSTLWVYPSPQPSEAVETRVSGAAVPAAIENEFYRVEARPGGTLDILDKASGRWLRGQNRLVDGGDRGDEYNYSPPAADEFVQAEVLGVEVNQGPVSSSLVVSMQLTTPRALSADRQARSTERVTLPVTVTARLAPGLQRIDLHTEVKNLAQDHRLRAHFAVPFSADYADYDGHFEVVRRPIDLPAYDETWVEQPRPEQPQRTFTAVSDGEMGLLVVNRGLPEAEVLRVGSGLEVAVTLLRCVGWLSRMDFPERSGHAGPGMETPGAQLQGDWSFDLALIPFKESERTNAYQRAYAFETPLRAVGASIHDGKLPSQGSLAQVEPAEFAVSAVKTAESGQGWVLRGVNLGSSPVMVRIKPLLPFGSAALVNLAEEVLQSLPTAPGGSVEQLVQPGQLLTVLFR